LSVYLRRCFLIVREFIKRDADKQSENARINEQIICKEVRLVDENGQHIGVVSLREALAKAEAAGLDLVEIGAKTEPHVCRIMDFGHYRYEIAKKKKEAKKKQTVIKVKEIKIRPNISIHDYDFKMKHAREFLTHGNKVKVICVFRGREITHNKLGKELLVKLLNELADIAHAEQMPKFESRTITMVLTSGAGAKIEPVSEEIIKIEGIEKLVIEEETEQ